jgi:hypothetical protein
MKRVGNLFEKITKYENIMIAHINACKGKNNLRGVQIVNKSPGKYCEQLRQMLLDKTYTTSPYHKFKIVDRDKERDICELPYYPDRIIQWALIQVIEPIFCKHFISTTYAAIPNKGTHKALMKLHEYMQDRMGTQYCLKLDVKKFFPNIDKEILKTLLRKKIKCKDTLWLLDDIVDSYDKGIPIGNFTSQYFGNYYLSFFDHWMKETVQVKYYLRYMDDLVILHESKEYLHALKAEIDKYLHDNLKLTIKDNWQVFPTFMRGIDFVGYRSFEEYTLVRNHTKKRLIKASKKLQKKVECGLKLNTHDKSVVGSYKGILKWGDCFRLQEKYLRRFI